MFGTNDKTGRGGGSLSFIAGNVTITGNVGGEGSLHIDGRVDGDVTCSTIILGSGGRIDGNIRAETATISGTVNGTVAAKSLAIEASARIVGDLSYDAVSIATGAEVDGRVKRLTRDDAGGALKLISNE